MPGPGFVCGGGFVCSGGLVSSYGLVGGSGLVCGRGLVVEWTLLVHEPRGHGAGERHEHPQVRVLEEGVVGETGDAEREDAGDEPRLHQVEVAGAGEAPLAQRRGEERRQQAGVGEQADGPLLGGDRDRRRVALAQGQLRRVGVTVLRVRLGNPASPTPRSGSCRYIRHPALTR
jgi:hypothetical protein